MGPSKQADRIDEKLANEYGGDTARVRDANRATFVVNGNPTDHIQHAAEAVQAHLGDVVGDPRHNFDAPAGEFKKAVINFKTSAGHEGEIQLTTPAMWKAKTEAGDEMYKVVRAKRGDWKSVEAQMKKLYAAADASD